ncbi:MAG: hypothetical protein AAGM38_11350 [Pseudomonadota bacterium]
MSAWLGAGAAAASEPLLMPPVERERAEARLIFLPEDLAALDAPLAPNERRVLVTGAYSSGDRFAPEGFVLRAGDARLARLQGWDGLLLVDREGRASLHHVTAVRHGGETFDLRDRPARRAFLDIAEAEAISTVQSHLLINEGALDLSPKLGAPRFRRRLLFETADGRIGVYDSSPRLLTLYEAAADLKAEQQPRFALNLDMGTYDFCELQSPDGAEQCGALDRRRIDKLTNVLAFTLPADR